MPVAQRMAASRVGQVRDLGPALDHVEHVKLGHGLFAEPFALAHAPKQRPHLVTGDAGRHDPGLPSSLPARDGMALRGVCRLSRAAAARAACDAERGRRPSSPPPRQPARSYKPSLRSAPGRAALLNVTFN
jgi:hypothetical protein